MKKSKILFLASVITLLGSCSNEELENGVNEGDLETVNASAVEHFCLDVYPESFQDPSLGGKALVKSKLWDVGQTITVKFLGGSTDLQNRVLEAAKEWEDYANIKFQVVTGNADIRVNFEQNGSSYSYIGTDAARINQSRETMNFGWFTDRSSDREIRRTTLHEFGHALGAIHEHQSPSNDIQWDREAVYEEYARRSGWSRNQVDSNLFRAYTSSSVTNSVYDPESIMHYPISNNLTLNNFSVDYNTQLSDLDKEFIGSTYPFDDSTETEEPEEEETPEEEVTTTTSESGDNVALGRPTSQSSVAYSGVSSRAVDGNTNGVWNNRSVTHTDNSNGAWWKVDLDETTSIDRIVVFNRTDNCCIDRLSDFYVEVLNESGRVTGSLYVANPPSPSLTIRANGTQTKSVRIRLAGTNVLSLAEVQVIKR